MKYQVLMGKGNYTLVLRNESLNEYAVMYGYDKESDSFAGTCGYFSFDNYSSFTQTEALSRAVELFRVKTEEDYLSRARLEELAGMFKDGLIEDDYDSAMEYFSENCEMTEEEKIYFGIDKTKEDTINC